MENVTAKKRRIGDKLRSLQSTHKTLESQYQKSVQKVMEQDEKLKYLQKREEVMTSSMARADQTIDELKRKVEAAESSKAALERQLKGQGGGGKGGGGGGGGGGGLLCHGCRKGPPTCVVVPCLHLMFCRDCIDAAHAKAKLCPACFAPCVSVMDVHISLN
eukprot:jgi/Tetstr1/436669/TSEL_025464.t1